MITSLFSSLTNKLFAGGLIAMAILMAVMHFSAVHAEAKLNKTIVAQKAIIDEDKVNLDTAKSNEQSLTSALNVANASITNLKTETDALSKVGVAAVQQAQQVSIAAVANHNRAVDAMPNTTCDDALRILKQTN